MAHTTAEAGTPPVKPDSIAESKRYWAFISYSHVDRAWADWLYRALERYRIPRRVLNSKTGELPERLSPVFLDRIDLPAASPLDESITAALRESRFLIVLCSPSAARSVRVAQEIEIFMRLNSGRVLTVIVAGRPNAAERGASPSEECFPEAIRIGARLAADVRPGKGDREEALLKLVAAITNIDLGLLRQRDLRRRRMRWMTLSAALLLGMVFSSTLAIYAAHQRNAAIEAQSRMLVQTALDRLKDGDTGSAQGIILEVLARTITRAPPQSALVVFHEVRAEDPSVAVLGGHGDRVITATYSPDGSRIVTASFDNTGRIWDARSGAVLAVLAGHAGRLWAAVFSPDGTHIATASYDKTARIWDAKSYAPLAVLAGHTGLVLKVAFSPDGQRILTASTDMTAKLWNVADGRLLATLSGHTDRVTSASFSPDGRNVLTASWDNTARIWSALDGKPIAVLSGHTGRVVSAAYSPDGKRIVTASEDTTARQWDARRGALINVLSGHVDTVRAAVYSPDGARIVTASQDATGRIWDSATGAPLANLNGHIGWVISAIYSPDGSTIVTTSADKNARVWDARSGAAVAVLAGHTDHVLTAAYSPDGTRILTACEDSTARIWRAVSGDPLRVLRGNGVRLIAAAISPDNARFLTASHETANLWDARTAAPIASLVGHQAPINTAVFSPDGMRIVTAARDMTARIWDGKTGIPLAILKGHQSSVESAAYSPDGTRIVTASQDNSARIWNATTGAQLLVLARHRDRLSGAAFSPDGQRVVTASYDKTARIWNASTGAEVAELIGHTAHVNYAAYSPDGRRILTASDDKTARIWDSQTGAQVAVISGHRDALQTAMYSPDGLQILTASDDGTARIWDARSGVLLKVLAGHAGRVLSASYSPNAALVITASQDGTAHIWTGADSSSIRQQVIWYGAAQFDPLSDVERSDLGLQPPLDRKSWPEGSADCDHTAGAFYDPDRVAAGVIESSIAPDAAKVLCARDISEHGEIARLWYEQGRALRAAGDRKGALSAFELAVARGHRAANVDLANLLLDAASGEANPSRAESAYERAWQQGVSIAAFELGEYYDHAMRGSPKAWYWYQQGADAGDPNALARFAERSEASAVAQTESSKSNALLLQAFSYYTAAVERAQREGWPDDAWKNWRYRRATLARLLAHEGMMQQVADTYQAVRVRWAAHVPTDHSLNLSSYNVPFPMAPATLPSPP